MDLDGRGIPGGMVATTAFEQAARAQSDALGFEPRVRAEQLPPEFFLALARRLDP